MQEEVGRLDAFDVGFLLGQEVQIDAVIEAVAWVPAMFLDVVLQCFCLGSILTTEVVEMQTLAEVLHRQQFAIHQRIEEDGAARLLGAIECRWVVVDTDGEVILPEEQTRGAVAMPVHVLCLEGLELVEVFTQPLGIAALPTHDEGGMLRQDGLVHIALPRVDGLEPLGTRGRETLDPNGYPSVHTSIGKGIEDAALLIADSLLAVLFRAIFEQNLTQGDIAEPRVPVPKHVVILCTARRQEGIRQCLACLAIHSLHVAVDMFAADLRISLHIRLGAFRHLGNKGGCRQEQHGT